MTPPTPRTILPGIEIVAGGEVTVSPELADALFDLAVALGDELSLPVDVEHVLGALVLSDRVHPCSPTDELVNTPHWRTRLTPHVRQIFELYGGKLGREDSS